MDLRGVTQTFPSGFARNTWMWNSDKLRDQPLFVPYLYFERVKNKIRLSSFFLISTEIIFSLFTSVFKAWNRVYIYIFMKETVWVLSPQPCEFSAAVCRLSYEGLLKYALPAGREFAFALNLCHAPPPRANIGRAVLALACTPRAYCHTASKWRHQEDCLEAETERK